MKSFVLLALFVLACSAVKNPGFRGADTTKWTPFSCRDGVLGPNDDRLKEIGACGGGDCNFFCQGKALGILNPQGLPEAIIYDEWVKETIPAEHHAVATAWFRDCFTKFGNFIDKKDDSCKAAKSFTACLWSVQPHLTCPK